MSIGKYSIAWKKYVFNYREFLPLKRYIISFIFGPLESVSRYRDSKFQVEENEKKLYNINQNICKSCQFNNERIYIENVICWRTCREAETEI